MRLMRNEDIMQADSGWIGVTPALNLVGDAGTPWRSWFKGSSRHDKRGSDQFVDGQAVMYAPTA